MRFKNLDELVAYLRINVPKVAADVSGVMKAPEPFDAGINLAAWVLADLPLAPMEAEEKAKAFKNELRNWDSASYISYETRIRCNAVIDHWLTATKNGTPLPPNEARVWA